VVDATRTHGRRSTTVIAIVTIASSMVVLGALLTFGATTGCKSGGDEDEAHILDSDHPGWKNQRCQICHQLPIEEHEDEPPPACAPCHGGNGACDMTLVAEPVHTSSDDCGVCHEEMHSYTTPTQCITCHYAEAGVVSCQTDPGPDAGTGDAGPEGDAGTPVLSDAVVSNCYNWPATPFTESNSVSGVVTGLAEGALAVELDLEDVDGNRHLLSSLLTEKPVLLVFGGFT
jgi:hypothetical protein